MTAATENQAPAACAPRGGSVLEVLAVFTRLGLTSFGGPVAHLGYFHAELVERRRWLDDRTYADLVALCQFLPGPASSQTGIALGLVRAGLPGALAAWLGFTMPSAALMIAFAYGVALLGGAADAGWLHGLKIVAVAVVAQAVWGMARTLAPDRPRATIALGTAALLLAWPTALAQVALIAAGGVIGWRLLRLPVAETGAPLRFPLKRRVGLVCWGVFFALLIGLPLLRPYGPAWLAVFDGFFRAGSLVFGGGHVVLPLLQAEVVPPGWVSADAFIAGYGAAQAVPGPLFTFAAYLGAVANVPPGGWAGGLLALAAIFLPAWLLVLGALPFWDRLRARPDAQAVLRGVNAAVVGVLLAALYDPVWTSAITAPLDLALALVCFGLLVVWKAPPWAVVVLAASAGAALRL